MVKKIEGIVYMDGYDDCLIGHIDRCGGPKLALYSYSLLAARHMLDGMTSAEAAEFVEYNQLGAYVGDHTPYILLRNVE